MSIRVLPDGADGYRLLDPNDGIIGWVRGRVIGVAGFPDQPSAIMAALRAFRKLAAWVGSEQQRVIPSTEGQTISVVHDGAYKWLAVGHVPIARLTVRASSEFAISPDHAFEMVLHGRVSEGAAIRAAVIAVETLTGENDSVEIEWPMRKCVSSPPVTRLNFTGPLL